MANCALDFAFSNEEECFVAKETTCGTLVKPTASDRIFSVGPVEFSQEQEFLDDEQIRASASMLSPIKGRKNPGEWSMNTYVKPSGAPGTAPEHDVLYECAMGSKTITGGTSVEYELANQLDGFSLWVKKGHTVFAFRGTAVQSMEHGVSGDAIAGASWGGNYMEQLWAGTATSHGTYTGSETDIVMKPKHSLRYREGMYIVIGDDDNSGNGYLITAANYTTDTLTITPALGSGQGSDPAVTPWWPTAGAEVGESVHGKLGMVTIDGDDAIVLSGNVTLTNNIKYYLDEKNNVWTAERFGRPGKRAVEGTLEAYFMQAGPTYFYRAEYQIADALIIPAGNVSGYIMELSVSYAEYGSPTLSGDEEFQQTIPFKGIASASLNDEFKITFK
jgi:hypothetical protein